MLLLPDLDVLCSEADDEAMAELDALIEATSASPNVLIVGTALQLRPNSALDNIFGVKLVLPGTQRQPATRATQSCPAADELNRLLERVARHYLQEAADAGFTLDGIASLQNGGGYNGSFKLNSATVFNDRAADSLLSVFGRDWFLCSTGDILLGKAGDEVATRL